MMMMMVMGTMSTRVATASSWSRRTGKINRRIKKFISLSALLAIVLSASTGTARQLEAFHSSWPPSEGSSSNARQAPGNSLDLGLHPWQWRPSSRLHHLSPLNAEVDYELRRKENLDYPTTEKLFSTGNAEATRSELSGLASSETSPLKALEDDDDDGGRRGSQDQRSSLDLKKEDTESEKLLSGSSGGGQKKMRLPFDVFEGRPRGGARESGPLMSKGANEPWPVSPSVNSLELGLVSLPRAAALVLRGTRRQSPSEPRADIWRQFDKSRSHGAASPELNIKSPFPEIFFSGLTRQESWASSPANFISGTLPRLGVLDSSYRGSKLTSALSRTMGGDEDLEGNEDLFASDSKEPRRVYASKYIAFPAAIPLDTVMKRGKTNTNRNRSKQRPTFDPGWQYIGLGRR